MEDAVEPSSHGTQQGISKHRRQQVQPDLGVEDVHERCELQRAGSRRTFLIGLPVLPGIHVQAR